jgi:hypothetical protein
LGQLIITLLIIVGAIAISLKQQLDKAAREEEQRKREPGEQQPEHVPQAMRAGQEPIPVEPEPEPEVLVVRQQVAGPEVVVRRVVPRQRLQQRKPPKTEARRPAAKPKVAARRLSGTLNTTVRVRGKRETVGHISLPRYKSPIVTAIVMHEILMPPVGLKRTQQMDMFDRVV